MSRCRSGGSDGGRASTIAAQTCRKQVLFPLTSLCLIGGIVAAYRHDARRSPMVLALSAWAVSLLLASPVFFDYVVAYSLATDAFAAVCLSAIVITYVRCRQTPRQAPSTYEQRAQEIRIATVLGVLGVLGCLLLLADARATTGLQFSLSYLTENLSTIREERFEELATATNRGAIGTLGGFTAPCAVLSVLAAVRLGREGGHVIRWLGTINFVLVAAVSLMVLAGRATIVNLLLLALISVFVSGRRLSPFRPRTLIITALLLVSGWYFATTFVGARQENSDALAILEKTQRAEPQPWADSIINNESTALAISSLGYFASPMPTFHFYMQGETPGPFYGAYSFQLPARVVGTLDGTWTRDQWFSLRKDVHAPLESRNYFGNVWATWLRDLLVDFGYFGAVVFCVLFGLFMAWARNRYELTSALHYHYLEVIACFLLGFGAFTSFLFDPFLAYPFFIALAVMIIVRLGLSLERRTATMPQSAGDLDPQSS